MLLGRVYCTNIQQDKGSNHPVPVRQIDHDMFEWGNSWGYFYLSSIVPLGTDLGLRIQADMLILQGKVDNRFVVQRRKYLGSFEQRMVLASRNLQGSSDLDHKDAQ